MIFSKCPSCSSSHLEIKKVTHTISGGNNTALIDVEVESCQKCGEMLFTPEQVGYFEKIKTKLINEDLKDFIPIGRNFRLM